MRSRDEERVKSTPRQAPVSLVAPLQQVFDETSRLFHRLRSAAEAVHGEGMLSAGMRGVMRSLAKGGAQSVPQLARIRPVSRQHIQRLVDELLKHGYVELLDNPAHRRSPMVSLSELGRARLAAMAQRERDVLERLPLKVSPEALEITIATLQELSRVFAGNDWRAAMSEID